VSKGPDIDGTVNIGASIDGSNINVALDLIGLEDINLSTELKVPEPIHTKAELILPQPLKTESRAELAVTEPIVTQMSMDMAVDVKPVVLDLCLNVGLNKLPRTCIRRPYDRHFGFTLFGLEVVGFNMSGESQIVIDDLPPRSHVEVGGHPGGGSQHDHGHKHDHPAHGSPPAVGRAGDDGLRIRLHD
jgi:hypothetical protein